ncbi:hypothetical protein UM48_000248 [Salmonella enterica subsp. enterica]|nr:hypothetical protein [Salmonella enterica subsp. enterica]EEI7682708.1 hypothetical protein [Salmonella enterica subsp. enterica serovar Kibusi]
MGNLDNGGYAFPIPNADFQTFAPNTIEEYKRVQSGMTLRDYFAAKAMQGICAHSDSWDISTHNGIAIVAYEIADAMLETRE